MSSLAIRKLPHNAPQRAMRAVARRYAAAIERRGRPATTPQWLADVWRYNCASYVRMGRNWLMLHALSNSGWYVASHFAPDTLRGGYRLLAGVRESRLPVVFTVPEDLAADLERVGWKRLPSWAATIADNCTDERAMELARLGVWLSDRPVASDIMSLYSYTVELDLGGFEIVDVDFDDLWAGADVSNADVIRVHDTELGCTSYVVTERASLAMTITRVDRVR